MKTKLNRTIKFFAAFLAGLALLQTSCKSKDSFDCEQIVSSDYQNTIELIEEYLEKNSFEGAVLIAQNKDIILAKGYGLCDRKNPDSGQIQINTTFEIGSITKQMTAAAIMQLAEKRKLSVNDKISEYFPDFKYGDVITIEMLLDMHSGLTDCLNAPYEFFPTKIAAKIENATVRNEPVEEEIILK